MNERQRTNRYMVDQTQYSICIPSQYTLHQYSLTQHTRARAHNRIVFISLSRSLCFEKLYCCTTTVRTTNNVSHFNSFVVGLMRVIFSSFIIICLMRTCDFVGACCVLNDPNYSTFSVQHIVVLHTDVYAHAQTHSAVHTHVCVCVYRMPTAACAQLTRCAVAGGCHYFFRFTIHSSIVHKFQFEWIHNIQREGNTVLCHYYYYWYSINFLPYCERHRIAAQPHPLHFDRPSHLHYVHRPTTIYAFSLKNAECTSTAVVIPFPTSVIGISDHKVNACILKKKSLQQSVYTWIRIELNQPTHRWLYPSARSLSRHL